MQRPGSSSNCITEPRRVGFWALALGLFLGLLSQPALGENVTELKYDAHSGSHFLVRKVSQPINWIYARQLAEQMERNGVRGRLATVKEAPTHLFLEKTFELEAEAWIGLRYWCRLQKTKWVTGEDHDRSKLNAWAEPWYNKATGHCGGQRSFDAGVFMPVYYLKQENDFRWRATGLQAGLHHFIVEFPSAEE